MPKSKKHVKPRNRAAQDATLINLRALQRRVTKLETRVKDLESRPSGVVTGAVLD